MIPVVQGDLEARGKELPITIRPMTHIDDQDEDLDLVNVSFFFFRFGAGFNDEYRAPLGVWVDSIKQRSTDSKVHICTVVFYLQGWRLFSLGVAGGRAGPWRCRDSLLLSRPRVGRSTSGCCLGRSCVGRNVASLFFLVVGVCRSLVVCGWDIYQVVHNPLQHGDAGFSTEFFQLFPPDVFSIDVTLLVRP